MSAPRLLTKADREWIMEHATEFAVSGKDLLLRDSASALLDYERTVAAMEAAAAKARAIIELGDQRLLAADGPCGGLPPDLTLAEWRDLYVTLSTGPFAAALPARNGEQQ